MCSRSERTTSSQGNHKCQEGKPLGENYIGNVSQTLHYTRCQVWAASQPHEHNFTDLGEHNHCRNPDGKSGGVWCYTTNPNVEWRFCDVPVCDLKVLDFSSDNDDEPDSNGELTSASLVGAALPESFTICSSFMVEAWTTGEARSGEASALVAVWLAAVTVRFLVI